MAGVAAQPTYTHEPSKRSSPPLTSMVPVNSSPSSSRTCLADGGERAGSRRRSSTTSSSSSGSTTRTTTMTIVRSSRQGSPVMSVQIPSPTLGFMMPPNRHNSPLSPGEDTTHGPRSEDTSQTAILTSTVLSSGAKPKTQTHARQRSNSSAASYHRSPSSSSSLSSSALSRSARSVGIESHPFEGKSTGTAPAKTSSVPIVRQTSRAGKGKGTASTEGSWVTLTSDNPFKRSADSTFRASQAGKDVAVDSELAGKARLLPIITTARDNIYDSQPDSPITPSSPAFGSSSHLSRPSYPYRVPSFSKSEPAIDLGLRLTELGQRALHEGTAAGGGNLRLPLTPLEEVNSPLMTLDSPADLAEIQDPFNARALQEALQAATKPEQDETFYHALLEIVRTEDGYTADLTDLVEVHFSLLSFARFITEEQRTIIVRDAVKLLEIHQRLQAKLQRVDEDLGWIRDHEEVATTSEDGTSTHTSSMKFKSSDATVADAARRISAIYINEARNLSEAYQPFCSAHVEAMDIVKVLSSQKLDWDAFEAQCTSHLAQRKSASTRLHFADFLIKPVQRICRYPMLFSALVKNALKQDGAYNWERLQEVTDALKIVAAEVDEAQKQRNLEIATVKLALRMDIQTPAHANLLNHLDRVILVGSAHVIYTNTSPLSVSAPSSATVKASFYGLVLYSTHLLFVKAKKTNVYEPRHWLPLRLFDMHKVADGDGLLPYAIRMTYRDHSFEIGSLCHQEQHLLSDAIETTSFDCRQKWVEAIASNPVTPIAFDESLVCSETVDAATSLQDAVSPPLSLAGSRTDSVFPVSPDPSAAGTVIASAVSSDNETTSIARPRLSLKPPAQRVAVDLRLADLLSDSILTARAQSKRSHAMPLHGPPPRSMTATGAFTHSRRPHSFHHGSFSYRSIMDSTIPSRRTSMADSESVRPELMHHMSNASGTISDSNTATSSTVNPGSPKKPAKLSRSRTSTSNSETIMMKPTRTGTLSRLRRRATSLYPAEQAPSKVVEDLRQQHQDEQPVQSAGEATVARNSSTSSSSSCGSASTNPSNFSSSIETPQSSLPASPLLTPVDLESSTRWSKFGDAITQSLTRKRSFASSRPILAVPPEPLLEGVQLERAQEAAEYIYTGNSAHSSQSGHGEYYNPRRTSSGHSHDRRYSWDKFGWSGRGGSAPGSMLDHGNRHHSSISVAGRSAPNLHLSADKRQSSSGSLWSVFGREGMSYSNSPTPSIYESAQEEEGSFIPSYSPGGESVTSQSPQEVTPTSSPPLASGAGLPVAISNTSPFAPPPQLRRQPSLLAPALTVPAPAPAAQEEVKTGASKLGRRNSITARLRAFRTLGSSMTPLSSSSSPSSPQSK